MKDQAFENRQGVETRKTFQPVPEHQNAFKSMVYERASNRHHVNRIKLFGGAKNVKILGVTGMRCNEGNSKIGVMARNAGVNLDSSTYTHSLIEQMRDSKPKLGYTGPNSVTGT